MPEDMQRNTQWYERLNLNGNAANISEERSTSSIDTIGDEELSSYGSKKIYITFLLCGLSSLLPWSAIIVANSYFQAQFRGSPYELSFNSYFSLFFMVSGLVFLAYSFFTQKKEEDENRVIIGFVTNFIVFIVFALIPFLGGMSDRTVFIFECIIIIVTAGVTGYSQNSLFAIASTVPSINMQGMMSGQAIAGMVAAITQLVGAYASDFKGKDLDKAVAKEIPLDLKLRTSLCFLFTAFMIIFTLYRFKKLISSAEYTRYVGTMEDELFLDSSIQDPEPVDLPNRRDVSGVFRQIRSFVVIIIVSFTITLALFPTLTTQVRSVGGKFGIAHLLEWHFVFFNLGDYVGRVISIYTEKMAFLLAKLLNKIRNMIYKTIDAIQPDDSSHQLTMYSVLLLYICCYARLGFFPYLFNSNLMCRNDIPGATGATSSIVLGVESKHALLYTVFSRYADIFFLAAMFIFGATNGWLISSSVVIGPQKSQDPALAGSILSFCISSGLAIGAAMSFLVLHYSC